MAAASTSTPPLGKYLASTDKKTRDKAIKNLASFLSNSSEDVLPKTEMTKLWKGIFYCFWMSDKPLVQQALASELAEIVLSISTTSLSLAFLRGFWETTVREWNGIDRLRMDKYYMLVRRFVNAAFRLLLLNDWDSAVCDEYNAILTGAGGPLCPDDIRVPAGLPYHLADIYLEELDKIMANPTSPSSQPAPLATILAPFLTLAARTPTSTTYKHIQSALFDSLFDALKPPPSEDSESRSRKRPRLSTPTYPNLLPNACFTLPSPAGAMARSPLRKALLRKVFEVASQEDTRDANRRRMYGIWKNGMADEDDDSGSESA
ncbi:hypothetical protein PLICRDRAFT_87582 [Plicaturopsis crispa FD-325 SS-3]|nr:hypothetical protein PLICRDRAFT_87582 [Plicaturopsis crispa FD-325 SS-3]